MSERPRLTLIEGGKSEDNKALRALASQFPPGIFPPLDRPSLTLIGGEDELDTANVGRRLAAVHPDALDPEKRYQGRIRLAELYTTFGDVAAAQSCLYLQSARYYKGAWSEKYIRPATVFISGRVMTARPQLLSMNMVRGLGFPEVSIRAGSTGCRFEKIVAEHDTLPITVGITVMKPDMATVGIATNHINISTKDTGELYELLAESDLRDTNIHQGAAVLLRICHATARQIGRACTDLFRGKFTEKTVGFIATVPTPQGTPQDITDLLSGTLRKN